MKGRVEKIKLKDGSVAYQARVDTGVDPGTGERRRKAKNFARKGDAERWLATTISAVQRGEWADAGRITVGEYVQRWYSLHAGGLAPRGQERAASVIKVHILPSLGAVRLSAVRPSDVRDFFERLRQSGNARTGEGLSVGSLRHVRAVLHQAFDLAVEDGLLTRNPLESIRLPQAQAQAGSVQPFTPAELERLFAVAQEHRLHALVVLAVATGARAGELLGLRWDDVDLTGALITISASLQRVKGQGLVLKQPKSASSLRRIDLPRFAVSALKAHRARQNAERLQAGPAWQDGGFVFTTEIGTPLDEGNVYQRVWLPLLERAGLPPRRLHDARHTHASLLLDQGENIKVVQERLGHADVRITLQTYSHLMPGAQRQAADRLDRLFQS